jgi:hypothetical protein
MAAKSTVESLRAQITACVAELDAIARAPLPVAEAEAAMGQLLDRAAARYDPSVTLFARTPDPQLDSLSLLLPDPRWGAPALWEFLAAIVDRPRLIVLWTDRLRQAYASDPTLANPIPLAERAGRLQSAQRRLHDLELAEERLIVEAEQRGEQVDRREDADPAVIFAPEMLVEVFEGKEVGNGITA